MKKSPLTIISLFDGMSCGQIALQRFLANLEYEYIASEIDKAAMNVAIKNFPKIKQVGDVRKFTGKNLRKIFLLIAGSPCTDVSIAGTKRGMIVDTYEEYMRLRASGFKFEGESYLFWEFVRVLKETKPKYFLLENVDMTGKNEKWIKVISDVLGVQPIRINSNLLTGQNRVRLYWTNIPGVTTPEDMNIMLGDVVEGAVSGYGVRGRKLKDDEFYTQYGTVRSDGKANCLTKTGNCRKYIDADGVIHKLTPEHCEVLQGVPVGYTNTIGVTKTSRYEMLGNGWTIPVIEHIFSFIPEFSLVMENK